MRFTIPEALPVAAAAITPEAGPDITVFAASLDTSDAETIPPLPFITSISPPKPALASSCRRRAI